MCKTRLRASLDMTDGKTIHLFQPVIPSEIFKNHANATNHPVIGSPFWSVTNSGTRKYLSSKTIFGKSGCVQPVDEKKGGANRWMESGG